MWKKLPKQLKTLIWIYFKEYKVTRIILDQHNYQVVDENMKVEIEHTVDHDLDYTYFEGTRIDIVNRKTTDKKVIINVKVDY